MWAIQQVSAQTSAPPARFTYRIWPENMGVTTHTKHTLMFVYRVLGEGVGKRYWETTLKYGYMTLRPGNARGRCCQFEARGFGNLYYMSTIPIPKFSFCPSTLHMCFAFDRSSSRESCFHNKSTQWNYHLHNRRHHLHRRNVKLLGDAVHTQIMKILCSAGRDASKPIKCLMPVCNRPYLHVCFVKSMATCFTYCMNVSKAQTIHLVSV